MSGATALLLENVSRETSERLRIYEALVQKWNPKINLVAKSTLNHLWDRHFVDSAQIYAHAPKTGKWVDIGSGGGFPGLVVAILAAESSAHQITLIESDARKCAFLRTVLRETGIKADVLTKRIEDAPKQEADILSARALASLTGLLSFAEMHMNPNGVALFPKGENWQKELSEAEESWRFDVEPITSETEPKAVILKIGGISRV